MEEKLNLLESIKKVELNEISSKRILNLIQNCTKQVSMHWVRAVAASVVIFIGIEAILITNQNKFKASPEIVTPYLNELNVGFYE